MKRVIVLMSALATALALALPVGAITKGGDLDGNDHPYVGLMIAYDTFDHDGDPDTPDQTWPIWRCSGALIDPTTYITAGHCVGLDPFSGLEPEFANIWFESDLEGQIPAPSGYPFGNPVPGTVMRGGGTSVGGAVQPHPFYIPQAFFLYDLGRIVLDEPVVMDDYADLPSPGMVDDIGKGRKNGQVTAVGYGLQAASANPWTFPGGKHEDKVQADRTRYQADLFVVDTMGVAGLGNLKLPPGFLPTNSMILSGDAKHGGTCFGDSGGPILYEAGDHDYLVGVTSFGLNLNCGGIGGAFRVDRAEEIDFMENGVS